MIKKNLFLKNNIQKEYLKSSSLNKLSKKFNKIISNIILEVKDKKKTLNLLDSNFNFNFNYADLQKYKKFKVIAIVGMGGSILGAEAICNFLNKKIKKKIYFFNNLDEEKIFNFKKKENVNKSLFLIISKSGNTIETLSNTFALNIIKKNAKNIIFISEKKNNLLFSLSKKMNIFYIEHKDNIGGRYSVLSEVGIIPAYLMGINTTKLRSEVLRFLKNKEKAFLKESAIKLVYLLQSKKISNIIFLNYSPEFEKFLFWCQQLIAESLGKKGKGFLPVISNVPKDHHSLLQLYLDGPRDKLFYIFSLKKNKIKKQSIDFVKNAQKNALIKVLKKNKIPFREFEIKKPNEQILGRLFSYFILETILIGKLAKINPFDQPAVEQVKIISKKLLNKKSKYYF